MIIADASFLVMALGDDGPDGTQARERLRGEELAAPHLVDVEVTSVLRRSLLTGSMTEQRAGQALQDLADLTIERVAHTTLLPASGNYAVTTLLTTPATSPSPSSSTRRC